MLRIGVIGITGRMGQAVLDVASSARDIAVVAGFVRPGRDTATLRAALPPSLLLTDALPDLMRLVDVAIDFSHPDLTLAAARAAASAGVPLVSGTTGLAEAHQAALLDAAQHVPIVHAANFSLGIAVLLRILPELRRLFVDWDIEIIERHHRGKRDAPSGTALALAHALNTTCAEAPLTPVYGRGPGEAPRRPGEVGLHAVRAGGEVGRHSVLLASDDEGLEITHWAQNRRAYARGALEAARRLHNRPPGLYTFSDLLFA